MPAPAPGAQAQAEYAVRVGDVARDRAGLLALWRGNLGDDAHMAAKFDWFYAGCPLGPPLFRLLQRADAPAIEGSCAVGRRRMRGGGRDLRAGLLVDFAIAPAHRSLGPGLILQRALLDAARAECDVLYGFPNARAVPIFKRLGWRKLVDLVRSTRVLRHGVYLRRRLPAALAWPLGAGVDAADRALGGLRRLIAPRCHTSWCDGVGPRMDALWRDAPKATTWLGARDRAALRWRFDQCPLATTRYLLLADRDDRLLAWFATQVDGGTLHVRDAWSVDGDRGIAAAHVGALVHAARRAGHVAVSMQLGTDPARSRGWRAWGFAERERRPVYGVWPTHAGFAACVPYLTAADEDE